MSDGAPDLAAARSFRAKEETRRHFYRVRNSSGPRFETSVRRAYEMVRTMLRSGELTTRDSLSESALVNTLGASRNAVRKALQQLADEGLLTRQPKVGTRLTHEMVHIDSGQVVPRGMESGLDRGRMSIRMVRTEPVHLPAVVHSRLESELPVGLLVETIFFVDDEPLSLRVGYVTGDPDAMLIKQRSLDLVTPPLFEESFRFLYEAEFGSSRTTIEAVSCEQRTAEILGIEVGSPVLLTEVLVRDSAGVARELCYTYYRSDRVAVTHDSSSAPGIR
jgi:GntR family transcriptional regulator